MKLTRTHKQVPTALVTKKQIVQIRSKSLQNRQTVQSSFPDSILSMFLLPSCFEAGIEGFQAPLAWRNLTRSEARGRKKESLAGTLAAFTLYPEARKTKTCDLFVCDPLHAFMCPFTRHSPGSLKPVQLERTLPPWQWRCPGAAHACGIVDIVTPLQQIQVDSQPVFSQRIANQN